MINMRPHSFLIRADHPQLRPFDGEDILRELFANFLQDEDARRATLDILVGSVLPQVFTYRAVGAEHKVMRAGGISSGTREHDDKDFRIAVTREFAIGAGGLWATTVADDLTIALLKEPVYCITLSDVPESTRKFVDGRLRRHLWYLGALEVDLGNPIVRRLCIETLVHDSRYDDGSIVLKKDLPEDDVFDWTEGLPFTRVTSGWLDRPRFPERPLSAAGEGASHLLRTRSVTTHLERVVEALARTRTGQEVKPRPGALGEFSVVFSPDDFNAPPADMTKLVKYSLNTAHETGRHKALLFSQLLAIEVEDWKFLAEQLIGGLRDALPEDVRCSAYGVQYQTDTPVLGKNGQCKIVRAGWIVDATGAPRLTTAYIPKDAATAAIPGATALVVKGEGDPRWRALYGLAAATGTKAATNWVPTPLILTDGYQTYVEDGGACGTAWIRLKDGRSSFAKWLRAQKLAAQASRKGIVIGADVGSQSLERAEQYCQAFARVLRLNGVDCSVETRLT